MNVIWEIKLVMNVIFFLSKFLIFNFYVINIICG